MRRAPIPGGVAEPVSWKLPGFAPMTRISCSFGEVYAAALRERDLVRTRTGDFRPIRHVKRVQLDADFLARHPDAMPVLIRPSALAPGMPEAELLVSPAQVIAPIAGRTNLARKARDMLDMPGVFRRPETGLSYTIIDLGEPADVRAEGLWFHTEPFTD